jgi:hopene-associated glycosyltransferase HpnB
MSATVLIALAAASFAAWLFLLGFRHGFWRADQRLGDAPPPARWPAVTAVIPARDEAATIGRVVRALLDQHYPGALSVVVVDDNSDDGTAALAEQAAAGSDRVLLVEGQPLEPGWTGKLWAMHQGIAAARARWPETGYLLLTDADILHDPTNVRRLVAKATAEGRDLVSLMVRLHCASAVEKLLIPAFVFFFQKLYPFPAANDPEHPVAAAAGGCMLVRRQALEQAGGVAAIRGALIDDCALAAAIKKNGPIWIGLAERTESLRPYRGLGDIWDMVARTAYTQLDHSLVNLLTTVLGMAVLYLVPPIALVWGAVAENVPLLAAGAAGFALMLIAYRPTWSLYARRLGPAFFALPLAALLYTLSTVASALRHWRGRGGAWKGRTYPAETRAKTTVEFPGRPG